METDDKKTEQVKPAEDTGPVVAESKTTTDTASERLEKRNNKKKKTDDLDLTRKSVEDLTKLYNEMVGTAIDLGIKKIDVRRDVFMTQEMGKRACQRLHDLIQRTKTELSKPAKEKTVKRATKKTSSKSAKSSDRASRISFEDNTKIIWTGKENPAREGTGKWKRIENVRTHSGKLIKTYLSSRGGRVPTVSWCIRNGYAKLA